MDFENAKPDSPPENCFRLHKTCFDRSTSLADLPRMSLSLLSACPQIHQEAALLPYQDNRFSFDNCRDLIIFVDNMVPTQSRAIERTTLVPDVWELVNWPMLREENPIRTKLVKVKDILILVEIRGWADARRFTRLESERKAAAKSLAVFDRSPITSAVVVVHNVKVLKKDRRGPVQAVPPHVAREWSRSVVENLLEPVEAKQRREAEEQEREAEEELQRKRQSRAGGRLRPFKG